MRQRLNMEEEEVERETNYSFARIERLCVADLRRSRARGNNVAHVKTASRRYIHRSGLIRTILE
jgi:hypothetical protein